MEWLKETALWLWNITEVRFILDSIWKLGLAALLSGIIGYEREHSHRPAGFRTHILVAIGSALVMLTSVYVADKYEGIMNVDITRMSGQVVSGIGFLGAGTILREGFRSKGLRRRRAFGQSPVSVSRSARALSWARLSRRWSFISR